MLGKPVGGVAQGRPVGGVVQGKRGRKKALRSNSAKSASWLVFLFGGPKATTSCPTIVFIELQVTCC